MAGGNGDYPFEDRDKLFAQNGWLQAEMSALKASQLTEVDLMKAEARIVNSFHEALNNWWEHKPRELDDQIDARIDRKTAEREAQRVRILEEQGFEIGPDGRPKSKVNPARAFLAQHWAIPIMLIATIAIARPEWIGAGISFIRIFM
ncbi:hypothetical protein [uncultured Planktomarina sp.]|jgi:hypothetical protein|uniref:hypothetical protein n=1 Tax=uncultured Planktomarina sp. TaxID=1538529 RepID=UPI0032614D2E